MADDDIYNNKLKYERFIANLEQYADKPSGNRKYQIKDRKNLAYFRCLARKFERDDTSYIRRLRLFRSVLIICHVIAKDLALARRKDIDEVVIYVNRTCPADSTRKEFIRDIRYVWKIILPEKDKQGRADETLVPYVVRHLSARIDKSREKMKKDRISPDELARLIAAFGDDTRMQALLTLIVESLGRPQEILGRNLEDVELFDNFAKVYISEHGKEGIGFLRCIDSYYYLTKWLNEHPLRDNPKSPLFVNLGMRGKHKRFKPWAANKLLRERCRKLGINKPLTLYSFKRNGVTLCRLRGDSDVDIQHRARWTSTKQLRTYDLSTQEDTFKIELIKRGLIKASKDHPQVVPLSKRCVFCDHENGIGETACAHCRRPLDRDVIIQEEKKKEEESRKVMEEVTAIREELTKAQKRDTIILKIIEGLARKGKMKDVLAAIKEGGMAEELMRM